MSVGGDGGGLGMGSPVEMSLGGAWEVCGIVPVLVLLYD